MAETIKIQLCLMLRDSEVADLEMTFFDQIVSIDCVNIINCHLLPHALQCTDFSIRDWLMSRLNPSNTRHYIDLMPIIFHNGSYRRPYAQLALSLETNWFGLSDHYWFHPKKDMSFCYESRDVHFKRKVRGKINQWHDNIWSTDLNEFLFHDMLFVNYGATQPSFNNPIFTTNGNKEKIWHNNAEKWFLEKRLSDKQLTVEVECLDFFAKHNILVPKFNVVYHDVFNRYQFQPVTVRKGFDTIQKQCIASKDCQLTPLNWYISEDCEDSIHSFGNIHKDQLGGYIHSEENLSHNGTCWVYEEGVVADHAKVMDDAVVNSGIVFDSAIISGNAHIGRAYGRNQLPHVCGNASICDNAAVQDHAIISGFAVIKDYASVADFARIDGEAVMENNSHAFHYACLFDRARMKDHSFVCGHCKIGGDVTLIDHCHVADDSTVFGNQELSSYENKKYKLLKTDTIEVDGRTLYRIIALQDAPFCHYGELGGYVESEKNLSHNGAAWIRYPMFAYGDMVVDRDIVLSKKKTEDAK